MENEYNKTLDDLIDAMYQGKHVIHEDWVAGEYIQIIHGEFCDERGKLISLSPWMLSDTRFKVKDI